MKLTNKVKQFIFNIKFLFTEDLKALSKQINQDASDIDDIKDYNRDFEEIRSNIEDCVSYNDFDNVREDAGDAIDRVSSCEEEIEELKNDYQSAIETLTSLVEKIEKKLEN
jgi:prefoldin subunit 5